MSSALERKVESLERRLSEERKSHRKQINAKNKALEKAQSGILFELAASYPHLRDLVAELHRAHHMATPLRSPTGDGKTAETVTPLETGASTKADRSRLDWIDESIGALAKRISDSLGERGPLEEQGPQCWEADCPARGWFQSFTAEACTTCGTPFGRHKPTDLTKIKPKGRCWTRGCRRRGKTYYGSCPECGTVPAGWSQPALGPNHG